MLLARYDDDDDDEDIYIYIYIYIYIISYFTYKQIIFHVYFYLLWLFVLYLIALNFSNSANILNFFP